MNDQKGNLYLIIAIIVGVVAIGAVGFVSWKYFGDDFKTEQRNFKPAILPLENEQIKRQAKQQKETIPKKKQEEKTEVVQETINETVNSSFQNSATENWKTSINQGIGYSFKYPHDWELEGYYLRKSIEGKIYGTVTTRFSAWKDIEKIEGKITFKEYVEKIKNEHLVDSNVRNFKDEKILLGKKEATKFSYEVPDREISIPGHSGIKLGELVSEIYVKTDKGLLYIVGRAVREKEIYNPIVNQILSTFKFTS